jgi:hypothetical protein
LGADGGLDAVERRQSCHGGGHLLEVVQRGGGRLRGQGAGPPGEVVDQRAGDPGAGQGRDRLQVPGELVALVAQRG